MDGLAGDLACPQLVGQDRANFFADRLRRYAVLGVVSDLRLASSVGLVDGLLHGFGHAVAVEKHLGIDVSRASPDRLNEARRRAEEALLVRIENRHQRDLRQVQTFAKQVHPDQHVELALAQLAEDIHAVQCVHLAVEVLAGEALVADVFRQVLRQTLGQRGYQRPLAGGGAFANLLQQVRNLTPGWTNLDLRIHQARRADDLLDNLPAGSLKLVIRGRRRKEDHLLPHILELIELQRAVVHRAGQAKTVLDQYRLPAAIAVVHRANLRDGDVAFVDNQQEVIAEVVHQRVRPVARRPAVEVPGIVLDSLAETNLQQHLDVVLRPGRQTLGLQKLARVAKLDQSLVELLADAQGGRLDDAFVGHIMHSREYEHLLHGRQGIAGRRVHQVYRLDLIAEELDLIAELLVGRVNVQRVAPDAKRAAFEVHIIAVVPKADELSQQFVAVQDLADSQGDDHLLVLARRAQAEDARYAGDDHHVATAR